MIVQLKFDDNYFDNLILRTRECYICVDEVLMAKKHNPEPWKFLEAYRGEFFNDEWPSLPELFKITASRFPERSCWECFAPDHEVLTYADALERIDRIARYLYSLGVRKGDRVAVTGKNSPEWAAAYFGILFLGAIVVPVDYALTDGEIEHLVDFVEIKGIFVDGERFERIGKDGKYGFKIALEAKDHEQEFIWNIPDVGPQPIETPTSKDLCAFLFTSGTTGTPKAVMLTHENFVFDLFSAQGLMNIDETDVFYAILPIHHAYTMLAVLLESMSTGCNLVFGKRLSMTQIMKDLRSAKVTMFLAVPMLYNKLLNGIENGVKEKGKFAYAGYKILAHASGTIKKVFHINPGKLMFRFVLKKVSMENLRICICGGGPLPSSTFKTLNEFGLDFVQGYGLTETSPICTLNPVFDYEETSIGKLLPGVSISFADVDSDGNGEILIKGKNVMKGYYKNQEATDAIIDKDGWLHTGDIGHIDSRGFVYLTGRAKNIIVTEGGKNVFPEEIEDHFQLYYDIEQICILGFHADGESNGESVCALVYPSSSCRRNYPDSESMRNHIDEIIETVNKELLPYKRIRKTIIIEKPMEITSTQKVKRFIVAKQYKDLIEG